MRSSLAGISLIILSNLSCQATEVIAIKTSTFIVIGSDSKIVQRTGSFSRNKIFEVRDVVFGAADLLIDNYLKIDYQALIRDALNDPKTPLSERLTRMEQTVKANLVATIGGMRTIDPQKYEKYRTVPLLEVLVVSFDKAGPHVYSRVFTTVEGTVSDVAIKRDESPRYRESGVAVFPIGSTTQFTEFMNTHPLNHKSLNHVLDTGCEVIEAEMNAVPYWLGPPIQMVVLDRKGIHWQQPRDEHCQKE